MRLVDIDLLLNEMNNDKTKYTCQIDINQRASKKDVIDITLKNYRGLIFDIIKDLPTIEVPQWIPVEERMPNKEGMYLVTTKCLTNYSPLCDNVFTCEFNYGEFHFQRWEDNGVIAWQPLPKPYQKGAQ